jgi:hypothetical protein
LVLVVLLYLKVKQLVSLVVIHLFLRLNQEVVVVVLVGTVRRP